MEPTDDAVRAAIATIAAATRLDWTGASSPADCPDAVLRDAPRGLAVEELSALSHNAGPAGRVWATRLLVELAPERGLIRLGELASDLTPVEVNTCLVGHRTVAAWAQDALVRARPTPPAKPRWRWPWERAER